jgi:hypothetical protein
MKTILKTLFFVLILQATTTDCYAESYRVRGEVYYETGQNKWTRAFVSKVVSEVPVIIKQSGKIVSFVFIVEPPPSNKYTVTVTLSTKPKSSGSISTSVLSQTFQSSLVGGENGPFEFEMEQDGIKVGGALGVSVVRHKP